MVFVRLWRGQGERKAILILLILLLLALLGTALYTFNLYVANNEAISAAKVRRLESLRLVDQLRQTSDDLTRMARLFAVTGDGRFEEYFDRILAIRDGDAPRPLEYGEIYWDHVVATGRRPRADGEPIALEVLFQRAGFSAEEFDLLREAKQRSDRLATLEDKAINAVKGLYPDASGFFMRRANPIKNSLSPRSTARSITKPNPRSWGSSTPPGEKSTNAPAAKWKRLRAPAKNSR